MKTSKNCLIYAAVKVNLEPAFISMETTWDLLRKGTAQASLIFSQHTHRCVSVEVDPVFSFVYPFEARIHDPPHDGSVMEDIGMWVSVPLADAVDAASQSRISDALSG